MFVRSILIDTYKEFIQYFQYSIIKENMQINRRRILRDGLIYFVDLYDIMFRHTFAHSALAGAEYAACFGFYSLSDITDVSMIPWHVCCWGFFILGKSTCLSEQLFYRLTPDYKCRNCNFMV
ncbi:MAG: hypothetical protein K0Q53_1523 [Massilibacillus sp.]|jgi:hypothetical protein|nr:hypothetical protein [Massilibacillus sp.]